MSYWDGKRPCWEVLGCMGQPKKGKDCVVYQNRDYPCWNASGTLCKGPSGRDVRACQNCQIYKKYGNGAPILVFDVTKMTKR